MSDITWSWAASGGYPRRAGLGHLRAEITVSPTWLPLAWTVRDNNGNIWRGSAEELATAERGAERLLNAALPECACPACRARRATERASAGL